MSNLRVAKRYASALIAMTNEAKNSEAIAGELLSVFEAVKSSKEFRMLLASPVVSKEKKKTVVTEVFKKSTSGTVNGFLTAIIDKGRADVLPEILAQYFSLRDEQLGIVNVDVRTAVDFSTAQQTALAKQLETLTKKKVRVSFSLDKVLKGGFIAQVGDTMLDASVQRQLQLLRSRLKDGSSTTN